MRDKVQPYSFGMLLWAILLMPSIVAGFCLLRNLLQGKAVNRVVGLLFLVGVWFSWDYPARSRSWGESYLTPQESQRSATERPVKLHTDLVMLDVAVLSKRTGQVIGGLQKEDFAVYEDGARQQVLHFSRESPPLSIVLLFRLRHPGHTPNWWWHSLQGSEGPVEMRSWESGLTGPDLCRAWVGRGFEIPCYTQVLNVIGQNMRRILQRLRSEDEVALIAYDDDTIWLAQGFTKEKQRVVEKIVWKEIRLTDGGRVVLPEVTVPPLLTSVLASEHQAIYEAAEYLQKASNPEKRRIILAFTTDMPTPTRARLRDMHRNPLPSEKGARSKDEILKYLLTVRSTVYALIAPGYLTSDRKRVLRALSTLTKPVGLMMGYDPWDHASIEFYVERVSE